MFSVYWFELQQIVTTHVQKAGSLEGCLEGCNFTGGGGKETKKTQNQTTEPGNRSPDKSLSRHALKWLRIPVPPNSSYWHGGNEAAQWEVDSALVETDGQMDSSC